MVAAIGLFGPALVAWTSMVQLPLVGVASTVACFAALALVIVAAAARRETTLARLDLAVLVVGLVVLCAWAATELYFYPAYGTDESAFVQYAATLVMHGHDPYTRSLLPALTQYRVPIQFATYRLNGTISATLAYPALSFLMVVPGVVVTHGVQAIIAENVLALGAQLVLAYLFLPRSYRALSVVLVLGLPFLFDYTVGGDIITMAVPLLVVVAFRWRDIGAGGALGRGGTVRAVALGAAASICQFPWFVAPFLAVALWRLRAGELGRQQAGRVLLRFFGIAGAVMLVVNLPFIVWAPAAWLSGVLTPLFQHAIPFGQGLIDLTAFLHVGGGNLDYYTGAAVCVFVLLLVLHAQHFSRLWPATFILPSVAFLFSTRSLSEYFIMVVAVWVVSVAAPGTRHQPSSMSNGTSAKRRRVVAGDVAGRWRAALAAGPAVAAAGCMVAACLAAAPLQVRVVSMQTNGQLRSIWRIRAVVTNRSAHALRPHFATDASGYMTTFWNVVHGPSRLRPGQRAAYTLVAPNIGSMPGVTQPFLLQAVTAAPDTISTSTLLTPEAFDCYISPSYVDHVIPLGHAVALSVQLRSPYGAPVAKAGVRVAMGQVIYGQDTLIPAEARINGASEGHTPVYVRTDRSGVATFHIVDSSVQGGNPLYFQAYVAPRQGFPYGYSEIVSVQWEPSSTPATVQRS